MANEASDTFHNLWIKYGPKKLAVFQREYRFCPDRRWRFDFAHELSKVAVEIEGITWYGNRLSRHQNHRGYTNDLEKYNRAVELKWAVLRYTQRGLKEKPIQIIQQVTAVILGRLTV